MFGYLAYIALRSFLALLNALPFGVRLRLLESMSRAALRVMPKHERIAMRNLAIAFPEKDDAWRREVLDRSHASLARLVADAARLHTLDREWVSSHIENGFLERYRALHAEHPGKGLVIATGHLGSFELLAHSMAMAGHPLSFVVRNFQAKALDEWWTGIRERAGNRVISRRGAVKELFKELIAGRDVALLFDQNVTRKHAVFVDLFGVPAATTRTPAVAALRTEAPVVVGSIQYVGNERYKVHVVECDFRELYADPTLSFDEKCLRITQRISKEYEEMIRRDPSAWFWMHRRWRTRPEGDTTNPYA